MEKFISSRDNKIVKQLISLQKRSGRIKSSLFVAECKRICSEALLWSKNQIEFFVVSDTFWAENTPDLGGIDLYILPDDLFTKVCDTETPQGILCVLKNSPDSSPLPSSDNILILDGVSEPGNMGTILRTADAMGFKDIYIMKGSADVYNPKVIRSTMGAVFRLNFHFEDSYDFTNILKNRGYKIITTALRNSVPLTDVEENQKNAIVIGNEAIGVSDEMMDKSDIITKIEMAGNAESLNAAVAAGIVMYKFSKKR